MVRHRRTSFTTHFSILPDLATQLTPELTVSNSSVALFNFTEYILDTAATFNSKNMDVQRSANKPTHLSKAPEEKGVGTRRLTGKTRSSSRKARIIRSEGRPLL